MEEISSEWSEMKAFCLKILLPALVAVSIKIAIQSKNKPVSVLQIIVSFVTGVGSAYLFSGIILENFSDSWATIYIAVTAISGEKIGQWLIYKFNVEGLIESLINGFRNK